MSALDAEAILEFGILLGVSVAAHMFVAYRFAPPAAVKRVKKFFLEDPDARGLVTDNLGPALNAWLKTEEAAAAVQALIKLASDAILKALTEKVTGSAGAASKRTDKEVVDALMNVSTGNPVVDGLWAMVDVPTKRKFLGKIAKILRQVGFERVSKAFDADIEGSDVSDTPALTGGSGWGDQP